MNDSHQHPIGYRGSDPPRDDLGRRRRRRPIFFLALAIQLALAIGVLCLVILFPQKLSEATSAFSVFLRGDSQGPERVAEEPPQGTAKAEDAEELERIGRRIAHVLDEEGDVDRAFAMAIEGHPAMLREMLEDGLVDANQPITSGTSGEDQPLCRALRRGTAETIAVLLEAGADPEGQSSDGTTPMVAASKRGDPAIVRRLIELGADPGRMAASAQALETAERMKAMGATPIPPPGRTPLEEAALWGKVDVVEVLLEHDVDRTGSLHAATYSGSMETVERLLAAEVDPHAVDPWGETAIRGAASDGNLPMVERFLELGVRPGPSALWDAANRGHDDVLRAMADAGVPFDRPLSPFASSPLSGAAQGGHVSTIRLLLELGVPVNGAWASSPAIEIARKRGHEEIVKILETFEREAP